MCGGVHRDISRVCRFSLSKKILSLCKLYKKHGGVALSKTFHRNVLEV